MHASESAPTADSDDSLDDEDDLELIEEQIGKEAARDIRRRRKVRAAPCRAVPACLPGPAAEHTRLSSANRKS